MEKPFISAKLDSNAINEVIKIIALADEELLFAAAGLAGSSAIGLNEYKKEFQITADQDNRLFKIKRAFIATNMRIIAIKKKNLIISIFPIDYSNISDPKYKVGWLGAKLRFYVNETKKDAYISDIDIPSTEFKEFYDEIFLPALNIIKNNSSEKGTDQNISNSIIFTSQYKNIETCPTCNHKLNPNATKCISCGNIIPEIYLGGLRCNQCDLFFTNKKIYVRKSFSARHQTGIAMLGGVLGSLIVQSIDEGNRDSFEKVKGEYHEEMFKKFQGSFDETFLLADIKSINLLDFPKNYVYLGCKINITIFDKGNNKLFHCYGFDNTRNVFSEIYPNFIT